MKYFVLNVAGFLAAAILVACTPKVAPESTETSAPVAANEKSQSKEKISIGIDDAVLKRVRPVYDKYLLERPGLAGDMTVRVIVRSNGIVDSVVVSKSTMEFPEFENAVYESLMQMNLGAEDTLFRGSRVRINFTPEGVSAIPLVRSAKDLMAVFKENTQTRSRVIYNQYLRKRPHFAGKITIKFSILENGDVEKGEILSATTDYPEFEKAILDDLLQWKFQSGEFDKCTVTIPLTFSED
jgi:hypothetical protein